jgi:protein SCO1/2
MNTGVMIRLTLMIVPVAVCGLIAGPKYARSVHSYSIPDVALFDQNGNEHRGSMLTKDSSVIIMDFIYTTCKTVCPVQTANFANFQYRLKDVSGNVRLISITIDPEHDSVKVLDNYQKRYRAKPGWSFLTGSREDVLRIMQSFSAYTKNRMGYYPMVFIYNPIKRQWIQIEGNLSVTELIDEYRKVAGN